MIFRSNRLQSSNVSKLSIAISPKLVSALFFLLSAYFATTPHASEKLTGARLHALFSCSPPVAQCLRYCLVSLGIPQGSLSPQRLRAGLLLITRHSSHVTLHKSCVKLLAPCPGRRKIHNLTFFATAAGGQNFRHREKYGTEPARGSCFH